MTENQETASELTPTPSWLDTFKTNAGAILKSWQFKVGIVVSVIAFGAILVFFWQHIIAEQGMKQWAARSNAQPIECMIKDTNDDKYVSCSAILNDQVVPLECGASIFNIGCRVTYGAAAPPVARQPLAKPR